MKDILSFLQGLFMLNNNDNQRVGLSQFREETSDFSINTNSITDKNIKLSDLLRRN
jgi:hypothetical protein